MVPASEQLVVEHGEIKENFSVASDYKVKPPSLLAKLKAGDTIRFTIDTQAQAIVKIEPLKK